MTTKPAKPPTTSARTRSATTTLERAAPAAAPASAGEDHVGEPAWKMLADWQGVGLAERNIHVKRQNAGPQWERIDINYEAKAPDGSWQQFSSMGNTITDAEQRANFPLGRRLEAHPLGAAPAKTKQADTKRASRNGEALRKRSGRLTSSARHKTRRDESRPSG